MKQAVILVVMAVLVTIMVVLAVSNHRLNEDLEVARRDSAMMDRICGMTREAVKIDRWNLGVPGRLETIRGGFAGNYVGDAFIQLQWCLPETFPLSETVDRFRGCVDAPCLDQILSTVESNLRSQSKPVRAM